MAIFESLGNGVRYWDTLVQPNNKLNNEISTEFKEILHEYQSDGECFEINDISQIMKKSDLIKKIYKRADYFPEDVKKIIIALDDLGILEKSSEYAADNPSYRVTPHFLKDYSFKNMVLYMIKDRVRDSEKQEYPNVSTDSEESAPMDLIGDVKKEKSIEDLWNKVLEKPKTMPKTHIEPAKKIENMDLNGKVVAEFSSNNFIIGIFSKINLKKYRIIAPFKTMGRFGTSPKNLYLEGSLNDGPDCIRITETINPLEIKYAPVYREEMAFLLRIAGEKDLRNLMPKDYEFAIKKQ